MKQDSLINTLFYSKNPLKGLNKIHAYYDWWYDDSDVIVIDMKETDKYEERIPYHLKDLVLGYFVNDIAVVPVLGRVSMLSDDEIRITPIKVLSKNAKYIKNKPIKISLKNLYPIVLTPGLLLKLGFSIYNIRGFSGYRKRVNGKYVKIKFNSYDCGYLDIDYTMKVGTNVFHGTYIHEFMEILGLYFKL